MKNWTRISTRRSLLWLFLFHPSVLYVCQRSGYQFYIGKFVRELFSGRKLGYFPYPHAGFWSDVPYELLIFISAPTVPMKNLNQNHRCANQKRNASVDQKALGLTRISLGELSFPEQNDVFDVMSVWKHVDRLNSYNLVGRIHHLQVSGLGC